jgi:hypothetical protein
VRPEGLKAPLSAKAKFLGESAARNENFFAELTCDSVYAETALLGNRVGTGICFVHAFTEPVQESLCPNPAVRAGDTIAFFWDLTKARPRTPFHRRAGHPQTSVHTGLASSLVTSLKRDFSENGPRATTISFPASILLDRPDHMDRLKRFSKLLHYSTRGGLHLSGKHARFQSVDISDRVRLPLSTNVLGPPFGGLVCRNFRLKRSGNY